MFSWWQNSRLNKERAEKAFGIRTSNLFMGKEQSKISCFKLERKKGFLDVWDNIEASSKVNKLLINKVNKIPSP